MFAIHDLSPALLVGGEYELVGHFGSDCVLPFHL